MWIIKQNKLIFNIISTFKKSIRDVIVCQSEELAASLIFYFLASNLEKTGLKFLYYLLAF